MWVVIEITIHDGVTNEETTNMVIIESLRSQTDQFHLFISFLISLHKYNI